MLDLMLGNGPGAFSCGEVSAWFRPWRVHHFSLDCSCGQKPCPVWQTIKDVQASQFHASAFEALEVDFLIDSSKELCWLIDVQEWAAVNDITIFNLLLWKDPVELAYSHWKRGQNISHWRRPFVSYYSKILAVGLPFLAINFGDLVQQPDRKLQEICAAVGMPYLEGKERFWEGQYHYLFGSAAVRSQVDRKSSAFRPATNFPPEFERQMEELMKQIEQDSEVQHILAALQRSDISTFKGLTLNNQPAKLKKPYPLWYYFWRSRQLFRRHFPERVTLEKLF